MNEEEIEQLARECFTYNDPCRNDFNAPISLKKIVQMVRLAEARAHNETLKQAANAIRKWNFMCCSDANGLEYEILGLQRAVEQAQGERE